MTRKSNTSQNLRLLEGISLLYVEDNPDIRDQLSLFLRRRVGTFHVATNGAEGLELFRQHRPDIVVTDILMPVMDGLKMAEGIRALSEDTPIIVTTAFNEQDYFIRSIDLGIDKYVLKPVDTEQLTRAVLRSAKALTQKREAEAGNALIHFILDMNPTLMMILDKQRHPEYVNKTFLTFMGAATLRELPGIGQLIERLDGQAITEQNWSDPIIAHPEQEHELFLKSPSSGQVRAFTVGCVHFPELDKYILSFTDITRLTTEKAHLEKQATTDALTGIHNREKFDETLSLEVERARRYGTPLSLIMFDIDHFKDVNDAYGHQAGDAVLVQLSSLISENIRENDVFARWGGEEFMILAPGVNRESAAQLAEKLRLLVEESACPTVGHITISFGVTEFFPDDTPRSLSKRVDDALYMAKRGGRNRVEML